MIAPFPYTGGKSRIAPAVWQRFGNPENFVEPFFGSGAVLLARPTPGRIETVNDADSLLCNFWRSVKHDPEAVAEWADFPVSEVDCHARHAWLMQTGKGIVEQCLGDPDFYDAKCAGWWLYGICMWIGSGWCSGNGPWRIIDGALVNTGEPGGTWRQRPHLSGVGMGINRQLPHLGDAGRGINRGGNGTCAERRQALLDMMRALCDRLRNVRVCCGDWTRVLGPCVTEGNGITGVFLDPPYSHAERDPGMYACETDCSGAVREWAIENGDNPMLRISLCGYRGEHNMPPGWECYAWKTAGGYGSQGNGRGRENASRERLFFSPHCLRPTLFDLGEE